MFASKQRGTVIAKGLKIVGSVTAEGLVEVNGQIDGELHCTSLVIARGAHVTGTVAAERVVVDGKVEGPIQGGEVFLKSQAHVYDLLDLERPRVEGSGALTPGKHTVEFAFKSDGPGLGKGGTATITVDGAEAGSGRFPHTIPFALEASETFDIGSDTGTGVNDADYQAPFAFDGTLNTLTLKLLPPG